MSPLAAPPLVAPRVGLVAGLVCLLPVSVWLGTSVLGAAGVTPVRATAGTAVEGLWICLAVAISLVGPRGLGSTLGERAYGLLVLIAVPTPLVATVWLTGATDASALWAGYGLLGALGVGVVALATMLGRVPWPAPEAQSIAAAALEIGMAVAVWAFRGVWLSWVGL